MTIKWMFRIGLGAALASTLVLLLIVLALRSTMLQTQQLQDYRYQAYQLGQLSSQNSSRLTMHARQYIATLDPRYRQAYNELVAQIQGQSAGGDGRRLSYIERLREMNFTAEELQLLQRSNQLSMALVATEERAFELVNQLTGQNPATLQANDMARWVQAHQLLNDQAYMTEVAAIMQPVTEFERRLEQRTAEAVHRVQQRLAVIVAISLLAVLIISIMLAVCYWLIERRVIQPTDRLLKQVTVISKGDLSQPILASGKNDEIGKRTQSSTTEIRERIEVLQKVTASVGQRTRQSDAEVQLAVDKASDVADTLQSIQQLMKGIHDMTTTIAAATEQQSKVSDDISERLIGFQDTTNQSSEQGKQVASQAQRLMELATDLNQTVGRFRLRASN